MEMTLETSFQTFYTYETDYQMVIVTRLLLKHLRKNIINNTITIRRKRIVQIFLWDIQMNFLSAVTATLIMMVMYFQVTRCFYLMNGKEKTVRAHHCTSDSC